MSDKPIPGVGANDERGERARFLKDLRERSAPGAEIASRDSEALSNDDPNRGFGEAVAVISMGNRLEAHGPALAPDIDDRVGATVALAVCQHSGARYLGHSPYCTDGVGELAAQWSPAYLPLDIFLERTGRFANLLIEAHYGARRPKLVVFISGHGGNAPLQHACDTLAETLGVRRCSYHLALRQPPNAPPAQHAADLEHAMALQVGPACIDETQLAALSAARSPADTLELLQRYPALGGMAGFYVFGAPPFDAIRRRYPGIKQSVADFVAAGRIRADRELGKRVLDHSVTSIATEVLASAHALNIALPRFASKSQPF